MWWGKIIGGILGWSTPLGPIGLAVGIAVGHMFDISLKEVAMQRGRLFQRNVKERQLFFDTTFLVMGYVAKSDGRVTEQDIESASKMMSRFNLSPSRRKEAISLYQKGKQPNFDLKETLTPFYRMFHNNILMRNHFLELQVEVAVGEGFISPQKRSILGQLTQWLGLSNQVFERLIDFHTASAGGFHGWRAYREQSNKQSNEQQWRHQRQAPPSSNEVSLSECYRLLGVTESQSFKEIRHAYRKLMSEHHPDKLVAQGLPEDMLKSATEKTQQIQLAYDRIRQARGEGKSA